LRGELLRHNILIRDCSNFPGLEPGYYRTAVLSEDKNKRLLEAVQRV
jgi:threonine-phosphate decarboxylase